MVGAAVCCCGGLVLGAMCVLLWGASVGGYVCAAVGG